LTAGEELAEKRSGPTTCSSRRFGQHGDGGKLGLSRSSVGAFLTVLNPMTSLRS